MIETGKTKIEIEKKIQEKIQDGWEWIESKVYHKTVYSFSPPTDNEMKNWCGMWFEYKDDYYYPHFIWFN